MLVVTFGEIIGRLETPGHLRLRQARDLEVTYTGAEASVAASICNFGGDARYVTALPKHALAEAAVDAVRAVGVDTSFVLRTDWGRLGMCYMEMGLNQRPSNVIYDRAYSAIAITDSVEYDWENIFCDADWLHLSGITPALSAVAAETTLVAAMVAKDSGCKVSLDLNFHSALWKWNESNSSRDLARQTIGTLLPFVDVVIGNEDDYHDVLGIQADKTGFSSGSRKIDCYSEVARTVIDCFPNLSNVAITLSESLSLSNNNWGAMLYDAKKGQAFFAPLSQKRTYEPYQIKSVVDSVGCGESFAGGLIFALNTPKLCDPELAIQYAVAAACLKHSIKGEFNFSTREEVEALMGDTVSRLVLR
ncbi:sugar kinase [Pelagicoccus sp. SDUM812003]|uniref:sugar kinase n=1 Tax=Pelagicoccus sp. SDUM812003 TaxID=3041267 RepID=UPI00280FF201|nr:sugar kinase [Pelagicoccus sp. SDUM812003]MDQ8201471.1 sugar kinase [Pelagicoccus sp. SDUM812003]